MLRRSYGVFAVILLGIHCSVQCVCDSSTTPTDAVFTESYSIAQRADAIASIAVNDRTLIALAESSSDTSTAPRTAIYAWNSDSSEFDLIQTIDAAVSLASIASTTPISQHLIVTAHYNTSSVSIWKWQQTPQQFILLQRFSVECANSVEFKETPDGNLVLTVGESVPFLSMRCVSP
jgi:hypothetical protein